MPTYQYVCTNPEGKHQFEVVQSFTDAAVAECSTCGAPVRKVYGSVGVVFKGSGFYRTDSRSGSSAGETAKIPASSDSSSSSSSASSPSPSPSKAKESTGSTSSSSSGGSKAAGS
ncbi:putative regulatory protein, FmdB family [Geodermatophilus amargosae]|uniref:Putative regulatory protein, FmdB family n=1 Tax=Geodermatophilus amargosae TaxID=1296565 RepID=A0A1I7A5S0_9ACTN|nr:FmdB family zinc ribbon protein [Geodermatophilus amargosae]SFT70278.1 putative regulatory protein, FmdB family [Geodermatophilus amargosae]